MIRVAVLGGGTGSFTILTGLKPYGHLTVHSIVTMMDSGGDSGRLRDECGVLPPGDVRRCVVALSDESTLLRELFSFRFSEPPLDGRSFGNLIFLALTRILGSEKEAIEAISRILRVHGRVIPVTWDHAHIYAELADGTLVKGEANIDVPKHDPTIPIRRVYLEPEARANPEAVEAIVGSDFIVLAPGNLYTSTVPNLLVTGIREALAASRAPLIYVANLMTRHGETDGYTASQHVARVAEYGGRRPDGVLVHQGAIPADLVGKYRAEHSYPVAVDLDQLCRMAITRVKVAVLMSTTSLVRHDPARTARALLDLFAELAPTSHGLASTTSTSAARGK